MSLISSFKLGPLSPATRAQRIVSIDVLRGFVMLLMAVDHLRVYSGIPARSEEWGAFFTRWVTHFCAPAFCFLAGVSIYLMQQRTPDRKTLAKRLLVRGFLLVLLELTVVRFSWTFNFDYHEFVTAGVIWMLGWCMVLMALVIRLKPGWAALLGLAIIVAQPLFAYVPGLLPASIENGFGLFWEFIYPSGYELPYEVVVLYVVVPWIGVMMLGYDFGRLVLATEEVRRRWCLLLGSVAIILFIGIALIVVAQADFDPGDQPILQHLLNQQKYPPSVLFLLMTLGPLLLAFPFVNVAKNQLMKAVATIGRVPLFYYLVHIFVLHLTALLVNFIMFGDMHQDWYPYAPFAQVPPESRWSLALLYSIYLIDIALLYLLCRWYAAYKIRHPEKRWLRYL